MPIYEYHCQSCNRTHEVMQSIHEPVLTECADCHGKLEKLISSTSFQLKGEGWYVTENPKKAEPTLNSTENTSTTIETKTASETKTPPASTGKE